MPVVSAQNLTRLRTTRHATRLALSVYHPASIWTAQVNGAQTTGDTTITVDNVVQVKAPAKNYLVLFGTAAGGSDLGTARWKSYSAPTLTVGSHNTALANDTYITVVEEIKPEAVHPNISATDVVTEDGNTAYTDENLKYQPLAKMGAPAVAYIDAGTGLATVKFYSRSEAFGGATLSTYAWVFPSGTPGTSATAGTAGTPVTVTWNTAGQYYVSLTVTDSNGKTHTGYRPVFIYNSSSVVPYTRIEVGGLEGDAESGVWSTHLTVHGDADAAEFPSNALCVLSAIDYYGAEQVSIASETWRENIVFVGYIRKGTAKIDRLHGFVEFDVDSVSGVADNIWQIGGGLETTAGTPTGWHTLKDMTYNLAAHHVLTQHSTITQIADCYPNLPTYTIEYVDLTDASLMENLRQVCAAPRGRIGCNAQGALYLEINPQLQSLASRSVSYVLTTQNADVRDEIDLGDELQEKQVSQIDFCGEDATADPIFSLAPEFPWAYGHSEKVDGIRVANQTEANEFAGLFEAYDNNAFADVVINWRGNYRVFDVFPAEPLAVTFTAAQNTRGVAWTAQRCWVKRVSYEYRPGILLASAVVEKDSYGALGVTGDYPTTEPTPTVPPPGVEPGIIDPPVPPDTGATPGDGSRVYAATDKGVAISSDFLTSPTWTAVNTGLSGDALDVYRFLFDPWSSNGTTLATAFISTKNGIWKGTGLPTPTWTQVLDATAVEALIGTNDAGAISHFTRELVLPINIQNHVGTVVRRTVNVPPAETRYYYAYSTDGGATWNCNTTYWWAHGGAVDGIPAAGSIALTTAWPSHKTAGTFYLGVDTGKWWSQPGTAAIGRIFKSTDNGNAWTYLGDYYTVTITDCSSYFVIPFANGSGTPYADDLRCWRSHQINGAGSGGGVTSVQLSTTFPAPYDPTDWTAKGVAGMAKTWLMDICTWDEDYIYVITTDNAHAVYSTNDQAANWIDGGNLGGATFYALSALPYNALFCALAGTRVAAPQAKIYRTLDGGTTWVDALGDLNTALPSITSMRSIVPDWIKVT